MQNTVAAGFVAASVSRSSPGRTATPLQGVGAGHASVLAADRRRERDVPGGVVGNDGEGGGRAAREPAHRDARLGGPGDRGAVARDAVAGDAHVVGRRQPREVDGGRRRLRLGQARRSGRRLGVGRRTGNGPHPADGPPREVARGVGRADREGVARAAPQARHREAGRGRAADLAAVSVDAVADDPPRARRAPPRESEPIPRHRARGQVGGRGGPVRRGERVRGGRRAQRRRRRDKRQRCLVRASPARRSDLAGQLRSPAERGSEYHDEIPASPMPGMTPIPVFPLSTRPASSCLTRPGR